MQKTSLEATTITQERNDGDLEQCARRVGEEGGYSECFESTANRIQFRI